MTIKVRYGLRNEKIMCNDIQHLNINTVCGNGMFDSENYGQVVGCKGKNG